MDSLFLSPSSSYIPYYNVFEKMGLRRLKQLFDRSHLEFTSNDEKVI